MTTLFELQLDKHLKRKLILICMCLALVVSLIYSVVAFRLSSDLGIDTEIRYLDKQAVFLLAEIEEEGDDAKERINELIALLSEGEDTDIPLYIRVRNANSEWVINQNIEIASLTTLRGLIEKSQAKAHSSGHEKVDSRHYIWSAQSIEDNSILVVTSPNSIDESLDHILKRLTVTSAIVFWVAVWLALTLSSWIAKRVQDKNEALKRLATHDNLTGLPNRLFLVDKLQSVERETGKPPFGTLFLIDLDGFKEINDALGHTAGDKFLIVFSHSIQTELPKDYLLIRSSGDEFLLWAPRLNESNFQAFAESLRDWISRPIMVNKLPIQMEANIGVAHSPTHIDNDDIESLILNAGFAMHEAKLQRSKWTVFKKEEDSESKNQLNLRYRSELADAISEQQIKLYYQPKVDLISGEIVACEALARWQHPQDGLVPPMLFIPLIEQSGKVREFGRYVIRQAVKQLAIWQMQGNMVPIAVNLSPYNLLDPDIVEYTRSLLEKSRISPKMLEIELTETATSLHVQNIATSLNDFKEIGVGLSIDDFGTGMSSLAYISTLDVDIIKIDRSFIFDMDSNPSHLSIVTMAMSLARALNCKVVAEGVENRQHVELLQQLGCHYGQGYFYSPPVPEDKFTAMLKFTPTLPVS